MSKLNYRFKDTDRDKNYDNYEDSDYDRDDNKSVYKSYRDNLTLKNKLKGLSPLKKDKFDDLDHFSDNDNSDDDDLSNPNRTLHIKEFDMNSLPPHDVSDNSGVKIVVLGKPGCFAPGTKVLMFDGSIKNVEDIKIGDQIMGDDGETPRTVQKLYHDEDEMYEICPKRGTSYTVNSRHPLVLKSKGYNNSDKDKIIEIPVIEYINSNKSFKIQYHCFRSSGVNCWIDNNISIDPYFLGVWLGDGTSALLNITNIDTEILNFCENYIKSLGLIWKSKNKAKYQYSIISSHKTKNKNCLLNLFNEFKLLNNKHIPNNYKISSRQTRLKLLAGIIDTDGHLDKNGKGFDLIQKNEKLMDDIIFIARSLGFSANKKICKKSCMYKGEKKEGIYYRCLIQGKYINEIPTLVKRKQINEPINKIKDPLSCTFSIIPKGIGEFYGFELDGNKRFLLSSFEVTHNTGKSTIIQDIMAYKSHICPVVQVFSGTEDSNHFFSEKCPPVCVFNKYDEKSIENFVKRQKIAKKYLDNPWAMQIIDDCTDDPASLRKPLIQSYYKNGRHWKMIHILSLQYCLDIRPNIRSNIDYTFILRESNLKSRKSLHENYAGCIDSFQDFCDIMDQITEDYTALVINNRVQSNKMEDCLFWYKANPNKIPPNWKFGHKDAWSFNNERFDPLYVDSVL